MSLVYAFWGNPHMMIFIWTWLSLTLLHWPSMYYFQCTCTLSRAGVCEATAFAANEATIRLRTMSCSCKHWLSPNGGIDGIWYIWYNKLSLSVVPYGNYDHQKMNIPNRFNNWFTSWNKHWLLVWFYLYDIIKSLNFSLLVLQ